MSARFRSPIHWLVLVVAIMCFVALPALAATAPSKDATLKAKADEAMMAEMMKYSKPGPMHALLDPLVGNWKTTVKTWMAGHEPTLSQGTCKRAWLLGGRFLQSKYTGDMDGMPFEGMELLGYDIKKQEYQDVWIDNMGTVMTPGMGGKADSTGKVFTIMQTIDDPATGTPMPFRMVTKIIDNDNAVFTMNGTKDGKEYTVMEMDFTRVK